MKKLKGIFSIIFGLIVLAVLASCGDTSGVNADIESKVYTNKIIFNLSFDDNEKLTDKTAVPHISIYEYAAENDNHKGDFKQDKSVELGTTATSGKCEFTNLEKKTTYVFYLYVTYNKNEEEIKVWEETTKNEGESEDTAISIKTIDDFKAMADVPDGHYRLDASLDFGGDTIEAIFSSSSSKKFSGTFDGNNNVISNFKFVSSNTGIFNYTSGATIKNLVIDGSGLTNGDYSSGKSTANLGILVGSAENTQFENVIVKNVKISIQGNSGATLNVGAFVGSADGCSFKSCKVENAEISYSRLRLKVATGLFAGVIKGTPAAKNNGIAYSVLDCMAEGKITGVLYFPSTEGAVYVGGFVGDLGASGLVKDSSSEAVISLTKDETSTYTNKYELCVGGFVGTNSSGSMNIKWCVAAADITVKAGADSSAEEVLNSNVLTNTFAYIGGFVGSVRMVVAGIKDSVYVKQSTGVKVYAKAVDDDSNSLYTASNTVADIYNASKVDNLVCINDSAFDTTILSDALAALVAKYNK